LPNDSKVRRQGYEVLERFHEEGESAKSTDRSQLQNLLMLCRLNKGRVHFHGRVQPGRRASKQTASAAIGVVRTRA
jgi:hypothetical protein